METVAGFLGEEVQVTINGTSLRLLGATGLESLIQPDVLLGGEAAPEPPYWMHLWSGAMAVARILAVAPEIGVGVRLLELGCGLGLPALVAARRGAAVIATDWKGEPLRFARCSAELNGQTIGLIQMDWRDPAVQGAFDVCVGADVAYDQAAEPALIDSLRRVLRPGGVAWLADSVNTFRPTIAAGLREAGFAVVVSRMREEEDRRPVWVRVIEARQPA